MSEQDPNYFPCPETHVITKCVCPSTASTLGWVSAKDGIPVVRCPECGTLRTIYRARDYGQLYTDGEGYHNALQVQVGHLPYSERYEHDRGVATSRIRKINRLTKVLDVGCANGAFVTEAAHAGYDAYGLELNPPMAAEAAHRSGRPVYTSWAEVGKQRFDTITYHDVFEHVVDPHEELYAIKQHLAPGGLLVLDVPDAEKVFGPGAPAPHHERPEQHLWYWCEATLTELLWLHGLVVLAVDRPIVGKLVIYAELGTGSRG